MTLRYLVGRIQEMLFVRVRVYEICMRKCVFEFFEHVEVVLAKVYFDFSSCLASLTNG